MALNLMLIKVIDFRLNDWMFNESFFFLCNFIGKTTAAPVTPAPSSRVELRVVVTPEILQVQRGQSYEITCGVYGADASTTIYWIQEEPERVSETFHFSIFI